MIAERGLRNADFLNPGWVIPAMVAFAMILAGCSKSQPASGPAPRVKILCSTFPMYLFTRNVTAGGDGVQVELMIPAVMGCPHDYTLTPQDMRKIASADVFIANGAGMEEYLGPTLTGANPKLKTIDTSEGIDDLIPLKEFENPAARREHPQGAPNPHLFACPRLAGKIVRNIADRLGKIDPAGAELYRNNAEAYAARLEALQAEFVAATKDFPNRKIVTEHAVFDYLARDCGLEIVAVVEENPGQEPAAALMADLVQKIRSSGAAAIFTEPQYPANVSGVLGKESGIPVKALDPVASGPDDAGLDYYEKVMRGNIPVLVETLRPKARQHD